MHDDNELLDLFDIDEQVVGTVERREYYRNQSTYKDLYLRLAEMFIVNDQGQLWVPKRTLDKKIAPGGLDYSAGGHVSSGESYEIGLIREVEEELGLMLEPSELRFIAAFTPRVGDPWFRKLFIYRSNEAPGYNTEDFSGYSWLYPEELLEQLKLGVPAKTSMRVTVEKYCELT